VLPPLDAADPHAEREAAKLRAVLAKAVDDAELLARLLPADALLPDSRADAARSDAELRGAAAGAAAGAAGAAAGAVGAATGVVAGVAAGGAAPLAPAAAEADEPSADVHLHVAAFVSWWDGAAEERAHAHPTPHT